jgi:hypothetical protein
MYVEKPKIRNIIAHLKTNIYLLPHIVQVDVLLPRARKSSRLKTITIYILILLTELKSIKKIVLYLFQTKFKDFLFFVYFESIIVFMPQGYRKLS